MAKMLVDASAFSRAWFKELLVDVLLATESVKFVFTTHERMVAEIDRNGDYARLFKVLEGDPRRIVVPPAEFERYYNEVTGEGEWARHRDLCNDGHIFALVRARNVRFVFSTDKKLGRCRGCMRGHLDRKFCAFTILSDKRNYDSHAAQVLS
jgi:hypothetical protein